LAHQKLAPGNGFSLVFKSRYISLIALLLIVLNLVNTTGEYILAEMVTRQADSLQALDPAFDKGAYIGAFYGNFFFWVNILAVTIQAFLVSRLVKYAGLAGVLMALPVIALGTYGVIAAGAGFGLIRWAKSAENSADYSIMNTARHLLWLPTNREEKYKAKQTLDTFFVRAGDVLSAFFVFIGTELLHLRITGFAIGNLLLISVWITLGLLILRENRRIAGSVGGNAQA
jgi:AAA family ATP:ADP antiporter